MLGPPQHHMQLNQHPHMIHNPHMRPMMGMQPMGHMRPQMMMMQQPMRMMHRPGFQLGTKYDFITKNPGIFESIS